MLSSELCKTVVSFEAGVSDIMFNGCLVGILVAYTCLMYMQVPRSASVLLQDFAAPRPPDLYLTRRSTSSEVGRGASMPGPEHIDGRTVYVALDATFYLLMT